MDDIIWIWAGIKMDLRQILPEDTGIACECVGTGTCRRLQDLFSVKSVYSLSYT